MARVVTALPGGEWRAAFSLEVSYQSQQLHFEDVAVWVVLEYGRVVGMCPGNPEGALYDAESFNNFVGYAGPGTDLDCLRRRAESKQKGWNHND